MYESPAEVAALQDLLDASYAAAGTHARETIPERHRVSASRVLDALDGIRYFVVATATADGRPLTAPVDGFVVGGSLWFGSSEASVKIRHLRARPAVSATYLDGIRLAFTIHGIAEITDPRSDERVVRALVAQYSDWENWGGESPYVRVRAVRAFAASYA